MKDLLKKLKIEYNDIEIYLESFTHMSFIHESKENLNSYERLEFLGDSILNNVIAFYIFSNYKNMDSGDMSLLRSNLVKKSFLSNVSKELGFKEYIRVGKGNSTLSDSIYEDVFESLIAAIYLDLGFEKAREFIEKNICSRIDSINFDNLKDYKTKLQEHLQSEYGKSVEYILKKQLRDKNTNEIIFVVEAVFDGKVYGIGKGKSKKKSEQLAAKNAYSVLAK